MPSLAHSFAPPRLASIAALLYMAGRAGASGAALWRFLAARGYRARPVIDGNAGPVASCLDGDGDYLFLPE